MKLPHYDSASQKGEDGLTIVKRIVERELNWIFRRNHQEHDFGIDAFIDIISESQATGKTIAVQIKTGESYFKEAGNIGWLYRDNIDHLNYYLNHDIPVLILLVNNKEEKVYWCACEGNKTDRAGDSWKITIPFANEFGKEAEPKIRQYISPIVDYAPQLERLWMTNDILKNTSTGKIMLTIDKSQILNGRYDQLKEFLGRLSSSSELIMSTRGKLDILIDGFNSDTRELFEIVEVKKWMNLVFENTIGLSYFLSKDEFSHFLKQLYFSWTNSKVIQSTDATPTTQEEKVIKIVDEEKIPEFLIMVFSDLNNFCISNNISTTIIEEISNETVSFIGTLLITIQTLGGLYGLAPSYLNLVGTGTGTYQFSTSLAGATVINQYTPSVVSYTDTSGTANITHNGSDYTEGTFTTTLNGSGFSYPATGSFKIYH